MLLKAENISKSYGNLQVLKEVNLEIKAGEIVSITGKSGAGKSTLLHIIGTLDRPDSGTIYYKDKDLNLLSEKQIADFRNKNIGFIFQFHHLLPEFTALENVCIPAFIAKMPRAEAMEKARKKLDFLGLSARLNHKPSQLSGGEQQRVAVARALMNEPDLLLADEPSGNLDTQNSRDLHQLFLKLRDEIGQTLIVVTHNLELAEMADKKIVMADGRIAE